MLHVGLCLLRLPPETLWAMTPVEFHIMAGGLAPPAAMIDRAGLTAMMERFPDALSPSRPEWHLGASGSKA